MLVVVIEVDISNDQINRIVKIGFLVSLVSICTRGISGKV
jgi:hypothetical protein